MFRKCAATCPGVEDGDGTTISISEMKRTNFMVRVCTFHDYCSPRSVHGCTTLGCLREAQAHRKVDLCCAVLRETLACDWNVSFNEPAPVDVQLKCGLLDQPSTAFQQQEPFTLIRMRKLWVTARPSSRPCARVPSSLNLPVLPRQPASLSVPPEAGSKLAVEKLANLNSTSVHLSNTKPIIMRIFSRESLPFFI